MSSGAARFRRVSPAALSLLAALTAVSTPAPGRASGGSPSPGDRRPVPADAADRLRASLSGRADSCRVEWDEPFFYLWEWAQARCEATRCELTGPQTISAVGIVLYNYGTAPAEKPLRIFLLADEGGMPGATLRSIDTTTTWLEAGETRTVFFAVDPPLEISSGGPLWFGHEEYAAGPPSSLFDGLANAIQASSTAPCGVWAEQDLGDYLQYLPAEAPAAAPAPGEAAPGALVRWRSLAQPVRGTIRLALELARPAETTLELFVLSGRRVETLLAGERLAAGVTERSFDATGLPSGIYLLRLEAGGAHLCRKVLVLR